MNSDLLKSSNRKFLRKLQGQNMKTFGVEGWYEARQKKRKKKHWSSQAKVVPHSCIIVPRRQVFGTKSGKLSLETALCDKAWIIVPNKQLLRTKSKKIFPHMNNCKRDNILKIALGNYIFKWFLPGRLLRWWPQMR